jgi:hypothetical protein
MPFFSLPDGRPGQFPRRLLASIMDAAGFAICGCLAFQLRFDGSVPAIYAHGMGEAILIWVAAKSAAFFFGGVNTGYWRYTSLDEAVRIGLANSAGSVVGGMVIILAVRPGIPRSVYILEWLTSCSLILGTRFAVRLAKSAGKASDKRDGDWASTQLPSSSHAKRSDFRSSKTFPSPFPRPPSNEKCDAWGRRAVRVLELDPVARHAIVAHSRGRGYRACACILSVPV